MKYTLFVSFLAILSLNAFTQQLQYNGTMEKSGPRTLNIVMIIEDTSNEKNIRGYYYYTDRNKTINLSGMLNGNILTLNENFENSQAVFLFKNFNRNSNIITGTWNNINNPSDVWTVTLNRSSSIPDLVSLPIGYLNIPPINDNKITIRDAVMEIKQGNILENGQSVLYPFTAPRNGRYRFEMAELRANARVYLMALDPLGKQFDSGTAGNGQGLTLDLTGGQTYKIYINQSNGFSPYNLIIGHQKKTVDISRLTGLSDSIQYTAQSNAYSFTAPRNGRYRFEMAELRANARVYLTAWNRLDERIDYVNAGNGEGLTLDLTGGQTYTIYINHFSGLSPYRLNIIK